ncbi:MAG TPA: aminotransferase DegT [Saprospirales bacterium]|nr:aminotransferase DegT [Saprospirales bacterium]HRQ29213.1 LegC family aminotransferase [Saprospiraceae bacterium]
MKTTHQEILNFIRQLYNQPEGFIPLHAPVFKGNEKKYLELCIESTFVSSVGQFVDDFELQVAAFTGAKKAVVCVNGTNALHLALLLSGVERETEVITQPLTFIATANAISYCGAHPVFIDVEMDTLGLSPAALRNWLETSTDQQINKSTNQLESVNKSTGRIISACVPMHTFGHPCRIDKIVEICDEYHIPVVEDAAESMGSFYKGRHTGTFGKIGVLSFNGNKIITTGGGGMLLFDDEELAVKAKHLTTQAKVPHAWEFVHDDIGYNYRMPNINAALGLAQLEQLPAFLDSKRMIAHSYNQFFKDFGGFSFENTHIDSLIRFVSEPINTKSNYWLNCILMPDRLGRDEFLLLSNGQGIRTRPVWELINYLPTYKYCETSDLLNANYIAERLINLPSSSKKSDEPK